MLIVVLSLTRLVLTPLLLGAMILFGPRRRPCGHRLRQRRRDIIVEVDASGPPHWDGSKWTNGLDLGSFTFALHFLDSTFGVAVDRYGAYSFFQ